MYPKQQGLPGNPYDDPYVENPVTIAPTEAIMALAFEQRTANLIAIHQQTQLDRARIESTTGVALPPTEAEHHLWEQIVARLDLRNKAVA